MAEEDGIEADLAELGNVARLLVDWWNRGDGEAFAGLFTPEAEYVTGGGEHIRGRRGIAALVGNAASAIRVRLVGRPVARCDARTGELRFSWSGADAGGNPRRGRITCACTRQGPGWLIEALHNDGDDDV